MESFVSYLQSLDEAPIPGDSSGGSVFKAPNFVPSDRSGFGRFVRGAMDKLYGLGGRTIDWKRAEQENQQARQNWQRSNQLSDVENDIAKGKVDDRIANHPDSDQTKQNKSDILTSAIERQMSEYAPNANPNTIEAIRRSARAIADSFTKGLPLDPPVIERVLNAVHADPGVPPEVKTHYWQNHIRVLNTVVIPAFNATPQAWYNTRAQNHDERYAPGASIDVDAFSTAAKSWKRSAFRSPSGVKVNVIRELLKIPGVAQHQFTLAQLISFVKHINQEAKRIGAQVEFEPSDYIKIHKLKRQDQTP